MDQVDFARIPLYARRSAVARHDASPHVLEILAGDPDADVRMAVASHPGTSLAALAKLAEDAVTRVASRARIRALARGMAESTT